MGTVREEMTFEEAGKRLSMMAQMTASNSQNWENFADIAASMLKQAFEAGQARPTPSKDHSNE